MLCETRKMIGKNVFEVAFPVKSFAQEHGLHTRAENLHTNPLPLRLSEFIFRLDGHLEGALADSYEIYFVLLFSSSDLIVLRKVDSC